MKINQDNYQQWALDYIEHTLPSEQRAAFDVFLAEYPQIASEIRALQEHMPVLPAEHIPFPNKEQLLRGGRIVPLQRIGSLVSGAVAASLVIGLFMLFDQYASNKEHLLVQHVESSADAVQSVPAQQEVTVSAKTGTEKSLQTIVAHPVLSQESFSHKETSKHKKSQHAQVSDTGLHKPLETIGGDLCINTLYPSLDVPVLPAEVKTAMTDTHTQSISESKVIPHQKSTLKTHYTNHSESVNSEVVKSVTVQKVLGRLLSPFDNIIPIKTYQTEDENGIEIASILRIGSKAVQ